MNYIISPTLVYLINLATPIQIALFLIAGIAWGFAIFYGVEYSYSDNEYQNAIKDLEHYKDELDRYDERAWHLYSKQNLQDKIDNKNLFIEEWHTEHNRIKYRFLLAILLTLLVVFLPSTQTLTEMFIAKNVTTDVLKLGVEGSKNFIKDIVNIIHSVK